MPAPLALNKPEFAEAADEEAKTAHFLDAITVVPWGVLGSQLTSNCGEQFRAPKPDAEMVIVDPAGLNYIQVDGPRHAGGAAGAIYRFLGIKQHDCFPVDVILGIQGELDAKLHRYGEYQVIHSVGPDFRSEEHAHLDESGAIEVLSIAYWNVLQEYAKSGMYRMRLLPLSGGVFSGRFAPKLPGLTVGALAQAFTRLDAACQKHVRGSISIELCVFLEEEFAAFSGALQRVQEVLSPSASPQAAAAAASPLSRASSSVGSEPQKAVNFEDLSPEQQALAMDPVIGDRPGTGHSILRVGQPYSPRKPPPDISIMSSMATVKAMVKQKKAQSSPRVARKKEEIRPWQGGGAKAGYEEPEAEEKAVLHFDEFWKAKTVKLSPDHISASWARFPYGGMVMSLEPVKKNVIGRFFEIQIDEADTSRWSDGLGIGIAMKPAKEALRYHMNHMGQFEGFACELLEKSWLLGYDGGRAKFCGQTRLLTGGEMRNGIWRPKELRPGDLVGLLVTPDGHMLLFVNEELRVMAPSCEGLDKMWTRPVFAVLDLDGCTKTVRFLSTNGLPSRKVQLQHAEYREAEHNAKVADGVIVQDW